MENKASHVELLRISPDTRINDKWILEDKQLLQIVNSFSADEQILNFVDDWTLYSTNKQLFQQCFLQIVTETTFNYPVPFFSEKTTKPILNKRPFVIVGSVGSMANLQSLGFKTFSDFWSEEYDTIVDAEQRITAILKLVELLCSKSINELQNLCIEMSTVLNYNFNYYVNDFKKNQLRSFEDACIKNLQPRYDPNKKSHS